ncbi:alpha/beta hydrolase [Pedobacter aquatilis]|uniref:alpha/beta hydrolase n=1 Tax=Pedobacter aquatilis TaxID=351343 RepID=UPI002931E54B|nr:alpha/beta hydrolase [Pedobacter aquatilis]
MEKSRVILINTEGIIVKISILIFILCFISQIVKGQAKNNIPKDTSYSVSNVYRQIHKQYPYAVPAKDIAGANIRQVRNLTYLTLKNTKFGSRDLHLDIFRPDNKALLPAVIMIHGGGWRSGDKSMEVPLAQLVAIQGFVTIPVEYQLSLEAPYPAAVLNIKSAIRWVKANAKAYLIDTNRIAISGTSAGGQLAALVGTTNNVSKFESPECNLKTTSTVHAVINIDGVISFLAPASLNLVRKADSMDITWLGGTFEERPQIWKDASAGFWANEKTVPILFLNSGYSRFHAGQDELVASMEEWGIYHEVHKLNVQVHPFWLFQPWADETAAYMTAFMKKVLR